MSLFSVSLGVLPVWASRPGTPTRNAYWDGHQMKFGDGYAASLDVTAHELTHGCLVVRLARIRPAR